MLAEPSSTRWSRSSARARRALMTRAVAVALPLFVLLATLQWAWDLIMWVLVDEQHFVGKALRRFLLHSFFYLLIVALPLWLPQILGGFEQLGQQVTGLAGLSPSSLFYQGSPSPSPSSIPGRTILITVFVPFAGTLRVGDVLRHPRSPSRSWPSSSPGSSSRPTSPSAAWWSSSPPPRTG